MNIKWIPLQGIPADGKTFVLDDQTRWLEIFNEFGVTCRIIEPVTAELFVLPQEQGVFFRGTVKGKVALPCDRCADDSVVSILHKFDSFEPYPADSFLAPGNVASRKGAPGADQESDSLFDEVDDAVIRTATHGKGVEINPGALAWEEFSLALPVKPLCTSQCKGLCPECGSNRNTNPCSCRKDEGDPRLAVLRGVTLKNK